MTCSFGSFFRSSIGGIDQFSQFFFVFLQFSHGNDVNGDIVLFELSAGLVEGFVHCRRHGRIGKGGIGTGNGT